MSDTVCVFLTGPSGERRAEARASLSEAGCDLVETASDADCLVEIVPSGGEPTELRGDVEAESCPVVLYADSTFDAGAVLDSDVADIVRWDSEGSERLLAHRIERTIDSGQPITDGGAGVEQSSPLEQLHEIAADRELSRTEKIDALLAAGRDRLGTSDALLTRIEDGTQEVVRSVGDHPELAPGTEAPLDETYCQYTIENEEPLAVRNTPESNVIGTDPYERFGLGCYLGTKISVDGEPYGTVCFVDTEPRDGDFEASEQTFLKVLTDWISYLLEQRIYERELDQQRAFTESLMDSLPDPLYATDETGRMIRWNSRFEETIGGNSIEGERVTSFMKETEREAFETALHEALSGEQSSLEVSVETGDEEWTPFEFSSGPLRDETGAITGVAGVGRDITERERQRERLSGILDTTRSLMQARDRNHVAEIAVNAARELLGFDISVFRLYNSDARTLEPAAMTAETRERIGERPVYPIGEGHPGEVFASGEPRVIDDLAETDSDTLGGMQSAMYFPVGVHGTISVCAPERAAFDETDEQMLALLATSAGAACMRAKREQEVREAQEHTERVLERVNGLVQNTVEVLVQATTRDELEAGVVSELSNAPPYSFAWIGQPDVATKTLSPTAWDGTASLPIQGRSFELDRDDDPVSRAYREKVPQVVADLTANSRWSEIAGDRNVSSLIAIPLVYKDANYGVLTVFATEREAFDERERVVLESLGRVIANAINAIERGRILDATEIIELEFAINDQELLFSRLSAAASCAIESAGTDYLSDGRVRLYLTATGIGGEAFEQIVADDVAVEEVTLIADHDEECLLEVVVAESLLATLTEYGAVPREVTADSGDARFTVELPYESEARELFELVEGQYPTTELLGYHERERAVETRQEFKAALSDRFTDRQESALRTAYLGGFFDWPRDVDGNELAEAMDISRPTYHQHLRAAQKKVFEELFE